MSQTKLRRWEAALFLAFGLTLLTGVWSCASGSALSDQVLRLHVIANSDDSQDQARKLLVRDAVLAQATPLLDGVDDRQEAEAVLASHLAELTQAGREALSKVGCDDPVSVTLGDTWFPTKVYDSFSLPAGRYRALRVVIGEGEGHNWWCVVFPPLCLASVTEEVAATAADAGLSDDQIALITGQDGGYVLRFKLVEWWEELLQRLK